jgi:hypothetical protein
MDDDSLLTIVRAPAWQALVRRLDAVVARDPRLGEARDVVLRPVDLLRVMAADAHGALGDDVLRADRLRAMLFVAWPYVAVAIEARKLLADSAPPATADTRILSELITSRQLAWPEAQAYEPGVIDHAALLVLALAAARVADSPYAPVFVASIHGLALAASVAEVLGRLDPRQPDADSLDVVLHALYMVEAARTVTRNEFLRPFAFDPVERGRWHALADLFRSPPVESAVKMGRAWDGATSDEIMAVVPKFAGIGDTLTLRVTGDNPLPKATVVFASADAPLRRANAKPGPPTSDVRTVDVVVPEHTPPGWIGFSRSDLIAASNKARESLRRLLATELTDPRVDGAGRIDPERSIPKYGALATPRRRGMNRFEGGLPAVVYVDVTPETTRPGDRLCLRWETAGADAVSIALDGKVIAERAQPTGTFDIVAPATDGNITVVITPRVTRGGRTVTGTPRELTFAVSAPAKIAAITITQDGRTTPLFVGRPLTVVVRLDSNATVARAALAANGASLDPGEVTPGSVTFGVPSELVRNGMTISVTIEDRTGARDTRSSGPLALRTPSTVSVVLVRPAIVTRPPNATIEEPIDVQTAHALVKGAAEAVGVAAIVIDLPWADDDLAALADRPNGDADPMLSRVLEALSRRALVTPRFEHATWLALLPGPAYNPSNVGTLEPGLVGYEHVGLHLAAFEHAMPIATVARWLPDNAARAVAVATPSGLDRLFAELYSASEEPAKPSDSGQRLAILGTLNEQDLTIADLRVDDRGEGPGAPVKTSLTAVTLDASKRELDKRPIRVLTTNRPSTLAVLVPVSAAVGSIEIRDEQGVAHKVFRRTPGELKIAVAEAGNDSPSAFAWTWQHTRNARPSAAVLLRHNGIETPVLSVDPCVERVDLPLWRYAGGQALELYATDGWNTVQRPISLQVSNDSRVVLRRLSDGRFFADVPTGWMLTWLVDGEEIAKDTRTVEVEGEPGLIELVARNGDATVRELMRIRR